MTIIDNSNIDKLVVIGGGTMGRGISLAAARRGIEVPVCATKSWTDFVHFRVS